MREPQRGIFPKDPRKSYGLVELVRRTAPPVERGLAEDTVTSWPHLVITLFILFLGTCVFLFLWSLAVDAPLREMANPDETENPSKAPWYFLSLQELLLHMDPSLAGVIVPATLIVALMVIPYIDRNRADVGIWFASPKGRQITLFSLIYASVIVTGLILLDENVPIKDNLQRLLGGDPIYLLIAGWVIPIGIMMGLMALQYVILYVVWQPNLRETIIGYFTGFVAVSVVVTVSGTFFRGVGFRLTSPDKVLPPFDYPIIGRIPDINFLVGPLLVIILGAIAIKVLKPPHPQGGE